MAVTAISYHPAMVRWAPDSRARLVRAALELYGERGFENTTVAEIAGRAGLTERTFFRHFADKREVLFAGGSALEELVVGAVAGAPTESGPIDAVAAALELAGTRFFDDRDFSRRRQAIIAANAELRERELMKLHSLAAAAAAALHRRGVGEPQATLAAESGIAVFRVAFERWIDEDQPEQDFAQLVRESLAQLRELAAHA